MIRIAVRCGNRGIAVRRGKVTYCGETQDIRSPVATGDRRRPWKWQLAMAAAQALSVPSGTDRLPSPKPETSGMRLTRSLSLVPAPTLVRGATSPINQSAAELTEGLSELSADGEWGLPSPRPTPENLDKPVLPASVTSFRNTILRIGRKASPLGRKKRNWKNNPKTREKDKKAQVRYCSMVWPEKPLKGTLLLWPQHSSDENSRFKFTCKQQDSFSAGGVKLCSL